MNIGINCIRIYPNYRGGVNSFTFGLLDGFVKNTGNHKFQIYATKENESIFHKYLINKNFQIIILKEDTLFGKYTLPIYNKLRWNLKLNLPDEQINRYLFGKMGRKIDSKSDVIYVPYLPTMLFPMSSNITILSIHDIQHVHYPHFFTKKQLFERRSAFRFWLKAANYIQASSHFIKKDFLDNYDFLSADQVEVIPEGVDIELFSSPRESDYLKTKYNIPHRYLFYPAQLWHHKNHLTILKALVHLKKVRNIEIPLVLTGSSLTASNDIFNFIKDNQMDYVSYLGVVPFEDLIALYQRASFLITAVLYESSSIPILEAAAAGTPIIASKTPPNIELGEILKINLFSPLNHKELSDMIFYLWDNRKLTDQQSNHNSSKIDYYSWQNTANKYISFFEKIAG